MPGQRIQGDDLLFARFQIADRGGVLRQFVIAQQDGGAGRELVGPFHAFAHVAAEPELDGEAGTGRADEVGRGPGRGTTLNFPLAAGHDDGDFVGILEGPVADALAAFAPELLLISAGFDAHEDDPLGHMNITTDGFARMTEVVAQLAGELCFGRIVSFLEGGYNLDGLAGSVAGHLAVLADSGQAGSDPGG